MLFLNINSVIMPGSCSSNLPDSDHDDLIEPELIQNGEDDQVEHDESHSEVGSLPRNS